MGLFNDQQAMLRQITRPVGSDLLDQVAFVRGRTTGAYAGRCAWRGVRRKGVKINPGQLAFANRGLLPVRTVSLARLLGNSLSVCHYACSVKTKAAGNRLLNELKI